MVTIFENNVEEEGTLSLGPVMYKESQSRPDQFTIFLVRFEDKTNIKTFGWNKKKKDITKTLNHLLINSQIKKMI